MNVTFRTAIMDFISRIHLASFLIMLPKQLNYSTFSSGVDLSWSVLGIAALTFLLPYRVPHSVTSCSIVKFQLVYQSCPLDTVSSLVCNTRSNSHFTVRITFHNIINKWCCGFLSFGNHVLFFSYPAGSINKHKLICISIITHRTFW